MSLSVLPGRSGFAPVVASLVLAHNGAEVAALPGGLAANRARLALAVPVCVFVEGHPGRVTEADDEALELPVLHGRAFRLRPGGGAPGGLGHAPQPRTFEAPAHRHHFTLRDFLSALETALKEGLFDDSAASKARLVHFRGVEFVEAAEGDSDETPCFRVLWE